MSNELTRPDEKTELTEKSGHSQSPYTNSEAFQGLYDIAKMWASSDMVPSSYKGKPMNCLIALDFSERMNISPLMVMQNLWIVKGTPTWSGQACIASLKASNEFKDVKPVYTGERGTDSWGCYFQATNKETGEILKGTEVTMKMAKEEGWLSKPGSKWKTMPEQMLAYRAAAFFARIYAPNTLMGCKVEGEPEDIAKPEKYEARNVYEDETVIEHA